MGIKLLIFFLQVLLNIVTGGSTPDFTVAEVRKMGVKIASRSSRMILGLALFLIHFNYIVFPLITAGSAIHGIREGLAALKAQGTDVVTARNMGPKQFFEVMGELRRCLSAEFKLHNVSGLDEAIQIDKEAGGEAYTSV